ncbi:MAG: Ig-like domain-containing protein [Lachnospiraceae bacterium]|nr:Ig-like domain-containing protein [Lachnospiraceae bacterium]
MYQNPHSFRKSSRRHPLKKYLFIAFSLILLSRYRPLVYFTGWHFPHTPHFTKSYILLTPGETCVLDVGGFPSTISLKSSVPLVATVTQGGTVRALKCGKTVITATLGRKGGKKIRCLIQVTELNQTNLILCVNETKRLYLKGFFFSFNVKYKSGDRSIAKVSRTGKVTAIRRGKTTITATLKGKEFRCRVEVVE